MAPARPQSVKELVAQAENFAFNVNIAMKHWIRAADTLYQEVNPDSMPRLILPLYQIADTT
jgi:STAM-binding protein